MLIQHRQACPVHSFSTATDKPMKGRLPLSALCNNIPQRAHQLPESSQVTSPSPSSVSQETFTPLVSHNRHACQTPSPLPNTRPSIEGTPEQHLPPIDHFHLLSSQNDSPSHLSMSKLPFSAHPDRTLNPCFHRATSYTAPTAPYYTPHSSNFPSSSTSGILRTTSSSELPCTTKHPNGGRISAIASDDHFLPSPYDKIRQSSLSTADQAPEAPDTYPKRRYSSQTASRMCTNCSISQTRQWVRGENHSWLCHSCGQFWRKNGYARPRALWNRPTFKRSSRKPRLAGQSDGSARARGSPRQTVSSSFLNGKKMIQWEVRLPPLQACSDIRNIRGTRARLPDGYRGSMLNGRLDGI